jgi:hypothetical protein
MVGGWRRLHNEGLHNLYPSTNTIRVIKSTRIGWAWHVERMEEMRNLYNFLFESLKGRVHSEDLDVVGKVVLEWISGKQGGEVWTGFIWLRTETIGGLL